MIKQDLIDIVTKKKGGRIVVEYNINVELSLQDENRTLKVFLTDKK
jgi:hypothetical protein